ncbi:Virus X resistance protein-like, coiled-coil domain [Sesbania bispinosa]|nr:Virus X resistance protein-like, coiled-coil domain [Sesbania bispinosa]
MVLVESIVSFVVERLGDLLIEEARFLYGVSGQVKNLQAELKRMQCFLRDAERRQSESESIKNLISEIRKLAYDAEDVIEIYAIKVACGMNFGTKNPFHKTKHLHNVGSEIASINSKISDITRSLQNYGLIASRDNEESHFTFEAQRELRWSYSHIVEEFIVGLDEDINKVVEWLLNQDQNCRVVYICGMGGLGKTTLAKTVYHYNAVRRHFEGFAWAYISQQCKKRDVWEGILLKLTSPSKEERDEIVKMKDEELAKKLYKVQKERKCLIILDDIWSNEAWDLLRPAFPPENTRSKIVFTSRNKGISSHVDPKGLLHEPGCLNAEDSWALFKKKAFPRRDDPGTYLLKCIMFFS